MASITKRGNSYQVEVRRKGYASFSKCFGTITEARAWGVQQEALINASESPIRAYREQMIPRLGEALKRYQEEVSPTKKSGHKEVSFLSYWSRSSIGALRLAQVSTGDVSKQRDSMLKAGKSPATVVRYLAVLSHVYTVARLDWGYQVINPVDGVRKPRVMNARSRRPSKDELDAILYQLNSNELCMFVLLAAETAMRRSELFKLRWNQIDLNNGFYLPAK